MYRSILVPLDGSNYGEHALSLAVAAARRSGADLHLVHVVSVPTLVRPDKDSAASTTTNSAYQRDEIIEAYLAAVRARVLSLAELNVVTTMLDGNPGDVIMDYAQKNKMDLVAMSSRGAGGLNAKWLGTVAESVVRKTLLPVLLTHPEEDAPAALDTDVEPGNILVPVQDSEYSLRILPYVQEFAATFDTGVILLEVVIPIEVESRTITPPMTVDPGEHLAQATTKSAEFLSRCVEMLHKAGIEAKEQVVTAPHAADAILSAAEDHNVGVIAMATHARHGVARLLFGSVAEKVVRGTTRAVLLCRPATEP